MAALVVRSSGGRRERSRRPRPEASVSVGGCESANDATDARKQRMTDPVVVAGVGMIPFTKPGKSLQYDEMGAEAARRALADAGIEYGAVEQSYVGYVYGDSTSGQKALYRLGHSAAPIINVNNNCSTGSSALWLARQAVTSGQAD